MDASSLSDEEVEEEEAEQEVEVQRRSQADKGRLAEARGCWEESGRWVWRSLWWWWSWSKAM